MLQALKKFFSPAMNPIGIDFGSDSLKLAQVRMVDGEPRLAAIATADVPSHVRHDPQARIGFFVQSVRDLMASGKFTGRQAVLALPVSWMYMQHLRMPRMDDEGTKKALPWEARGKLPIDPSHAILRHVVAGEIYHDQDPKNEVILMAAGKELINQFLGAASRAHLDVVGMNVEPAAIIDCFRHVYRRKSDVDTVNCFVDIGASGARAFVARGGRLHFARAIPVGGDHLARAAATALGIGEEEASILRYQLAARNDGGQQTQMPAPAEQEQEGLALLGAGLAAAGKIDSATAMGTAVYEAPAKPADSAAQARKVEQACQAALDKLVSELDLCRRYYEATFPARPIDRLIFIGGESHHRGLCQYIAQQMGLAAQIGDPLVRIAREDSPEPGAEPEIRMPHPEWCTAIGLSIGQFRPPQSGRPALDDTSLDLTNRRSDT